MWLVAMRNRENVYVLQYENGALVCTCFVLVKLRAPCAHCMLLMTEGHIALTLLHFAPSLVRLDAPQDLVWKLSSMEPAMLPSSNVSGFVYDVLREHGRLYLIAGVHFVFPEEDGEEEEEVLDSIETVARVEPTQVCMYVSFYVCLCLSMSVYVCLCLSMPVYVCLCLSMSVYVCLCLYVSLCVYLCLSLHVYMSICVCLCMSVSFCACMCLSLYVCVFLYMYVSVFVFVFLFLYVLFVCVCLCRSVSVCVCLSMCLSVPVFSICLSVSVCIYLYLSVYGCVIMCMSVCVCIRWFCV
jgi:hypothetical protein